MILDNSKFTGSPSRCSVEMFLTKTENHIEILASSVTFSFLFTFCLTKTDVKYLLRKRNESQTCVYQFANKRFESHYNKRS